MAEETKKPKTVKVGDVLAKDKTEKPKPESKSASKDSKKKTKHKHTHIESHHDAETGKTSYTVRHQPMGGGEEVSYAAPDLDAVHDGMEEHVGEPNAGEEQEEAAEQQPQQAQPQLQQQAV